MSGRVPSRLILIAFIGALTGCARSTSEPPSPAEHPRPAEPPRPDIHPDRTTQPQLDIPACCGREVLESGLALAQRYRNEKIAQRRFTHAAFWEAVSAPVAASALRTETVGRSINGREIRSVTFGEGPVTVLLWSQMHGDESTASMALADLFGFLTGRDTSAIRDRLRRRLTITFVPMLNPDGAELFQRENAVGIDVNRDARQLATPEARTLKAVHERVRPQFGFNLHDQNARTRVGAQGLPAAIALLAPPYDSAREYNEVRSRARLVAAAIARILEPELEGRIAKYDDSFNPRAFGDLMQQWGTSTVLIESGALPDDPQKQRLRALNFAAILAALDAIATESYRTADASWYERLPVNTGGASDLLVLGGQIVLPGKEPVRADLALNYEDPVARTAPRIREVGDLREAIAVDTLQAQGLFIHPEPGSLTRNDAGVWLRVGTRARFDVRRGMEPGSALVRRIGEEPGR
jgi:hypothetical protein